VAQNILHFVYFWRKIVKNPRVLSALSTILFLASLCFASNAKAERKFTQICNQTKYPLDIANAYQRNNVWNTEGWFNIKANQCINMYPIRNGLRDHFLYAENQITRYTGEHIFCVYRTFAKFEVSSADMCRGKQSDGSEPVKFVRITHMQYQDICITPRGIKVCQ
jgi:uncharacterized membrane protein